jgi:Na+-driven multidrug efflux pump
MFRSDSCTKIVIKDLKIDRDMLKKIIKIGLPSSIQIALTQFSNVFVQSYINGFGKDYMSAWTAYSKIDQLILLPMQSISLASSTFVGQNLGKKQSERARKGVSTAMFISIISTAVLMIPVLVFAPGLVEIFNDTPNVIEYGALLLRYITPFYLLCCVNQILVGAIRGAGDSKATMIMLLASFVFFRQIYLFIFTKIFPGNFLTVAISYPAGWMLASLLTYIYYKKYKLERSSLALDDKSS